MAIDAIAEIDSPGKQRMGAARAIWKPREKAADAAMAIPTMMGTAKRSPVRE